jgi:hypothetical protein
VSPVKKHLSLVILRLAIAYGIVYVMPLGHLHWGQPYPGDGQKAFGFILVFFGIGLATAVLYLIIASLLHFFRRRRSWVGIFGADAFLGACFAGLLAFAGITASYSESPGSSTSLRTTPPATGRR